MLETLSDEEVRARALADPDAQPTEPDFWRDASVRLPGKTRIHLDLDDDVLAWFKAQGKAYGQRMNEALRAFALSQQDPRTAGEIAEPARLYDAAGSNCEDSEAESEPQSGGQKA